MGTEIFHPSATQSGDAGPRVNQLHFGGLMAALRCPLPGGTAPGATVPGPTGVEPGTNVSELSVAQKFSCS